MAGKALRSASRLVFFVCGAISLAVGWLYAMLRGENLPVEKEWVIFVAALGLVGGCSVIVTVLPHTWIAKACGKEKDDESLISTPLKLLSGLAAIFYIVGLAAMYVPRGWNLNPQLMLAMFPLYIVRMAIDPSAVWIFLVLAPMNAAIYGSLGVTLGYTRLVFARGKMKIRSVA